MKSTIERIAAALAGKHWMYQVADRRLDAIKMCADCRVIAVTEAEFDGAKTPPRPTPRTSDDYLRERETRGTAPKEES